jgi:hypothetical protein
MFKSITKYLETIFDALPKNVLIAIIMILLTIVTYIGIGSPGLNKKENIDSEEIKKIVYIETSKLKEEIRLLREDNNKLKNKLKENKSTINSVDRNSVDRDNELNLNLRRYILLTDNNSDKILEIIAMQDYQKNVEILTLNSSSESTSEKESFKIEFETKSIDTNIIDELSHDVIEEITTESISIDAIKIDTNKKEFFLKRWFNN